MSYYGYYADSSITGDEQFSDPYSITMAYWYLIPTGFSGATMLQINNGSANRLITGASLISAYAYSDDDFDPGHRAEITGLSLSNDTWYHVAGVWSASNARKIYLNGGTLLGGQEATDTANTALSLTTPVIVLGNSPSIPQADVAIWNTALTDAEIAFLANGGRPHQLTSRLGNLSIYIPNRRVSIVAPPGAAATSTVDDMTGRTPTFVDLVSDGSFPPSLHEVQICPAHKE